MRNGISTLASPASTATDMDVMKDAVLFVIVMAICVLPANSDALRCPRSFNLNFATLFASRRSSWIFPFSKPITAFPDVFATAL